MTLATPGFTIAYWCVFLAVLLPLACAWLAKSGGFDNRDPRAWLARQQGWHARANAAQANSFEALPFFVAAVVIAHQLGAPQSRVDILAVLFVTLRVVYIALYVADLPRARSGVWTLAFLANAGIFFAGWR